MEDRGAHPPVRICYHNNYTPSQQFLHPVRSLNVRVEYISAENAPNELNVISRSWESRTLNVKVEQLELSFNTAVPARCEITTVIVTC